MTNEINIVWLKRDLRSQDHQPLYKAEQAHLPYLIIYIFEPDLINYPDTSIRHLQFCYHSIQALNKVFKRFERQVETFYGKADEVFAFLSSQFKIHKIFSYQESGIQISWDRDKRVKTLFQDLKIVWEQSPRDGIIRGITNREGWDKKWHVTMSQSLTVNEYSTGTLSLSHHSFLMPERLKDVLQQYDPLFQPAGEANGWKYLHSFVTKRGFKYNFHISKPTQSRTSCSRISVYLAWGNLSVKQAYQFVKNHGNYPNHKLPFSGFLTRLKWHCHFIQKFEVECRYETDCVNQGYELLDHNTDERLINAWKNGQTGYPLVDACMRCIQATGWINFRMRAMLVSFLCHHLDQDWRMGAHFLAQQFLDYEPGIHYPQFQMQAGTTGINTVRIYNPVKQSKDHDPEGLFIKKWIPELGPVATSYIHEPWKMTEMEQVLYRIKIGEDYPHPVVNLEESGKKARDKIWGHRNHEAVRKEKQRILITHTRRRK